MSHERVAANRRNGLRLRHDDPIALALVGAIRTGDLASLRGPYLLRDRASPVDRAGWRRLLRRPLRLQLPVAPEAQARLA